MVTIVPFASSPKRLPQCERVARRFWEELGAEVRIAIPDAPGDARDADPIAGTDIIVLTGGYPVRLRSKLAGTDLWTSILALWAAGTAVSGSSAGCMELCEWTVRLQGPNPLKLVPGLGLLKNCVSLPHFNRYGISRLSPRLLRIAGLNLIGVDERTGLIGSGDRYEVIGEGCVTIIRDGQVAKYRCGAFLELMGS